LRAEGIPPVFIVAALAEIAVSTAKLDPADTDTQLQALLRVVTHSNTTRPVAEQFHDSFIAGRPSSLRNTSNASNRVAALGYRPAASERQRLTTRECFEF
jgi:hypothetical protein